MTEMKSANLQVRGPIPLHAGAHVKTMLLTNFFQLFMIKN